MKLRFTALAFIPLALLALAAPVMAAEGESAPAECFREDFHKFLNDLEQLPGFPAADIVAAREAIDAASPEAQELIRMQLESSPAWRQLPEVMSAFAAGEVEYRRQELSLMIEAAMRPGEERERDREVENAERMRRTMLFMVSQLRSLAPVMEPEYDANLARAAATIETLPATALPQMYTMMGGLAQRMQSQLGGEGAIGTFSEGPVAPTHGACGDDCDWDITGVCHSVCHGVSDAIQAIANALQAAIDGFLSVVSGPITSIVNAITSLPNTITNAFNDLFGRVKTFFTDAINALVALIPSSPQEVFDALVPAAVKSVAAIQTWIANAPTIPDLCPPQNVLDVAADICGRGADELTALFVKLAPGDTVGLVAKIPLVLLDSGLQYLCMCADHKEAEAFDMAQAHHRLVTSQMLDQKLSLLATGESVEGLYTSLGSLDSDVEMVEAKVDTLGTEAGDLRVALLEEETFLHGFRDLLVRVKIEENLLENKPDAVSTYQLPEAYGGMLGRVRDIAWSTFEMTEDALQTTNGAFRELQRADALFNVGNFVKAFEAYRSAYFEAVK